MKNNEKNDKKSDQRVIRVGVRRSVIDYDTLVKPVIMMIEDIQGIDETYVVSPKLQGERVLVEVDTGVMIINNGFSRIEREVDPFYSFKIDAELIEDQLFCLDVLEVEGYSVREKFLSGRLQSVRASVMREYGIKLQRYESYGTEEAEEIIAAAEEGVIIQRANAPYGKQSMALYKVKQVETIDLKVDNEVLITDIPERYEVEALKNVEIDAEIGPLLNKVIVEYDWEKKRVIRERMDKDTPNSLGVVAKAMSDTRVSMRILKSYHEDYRKRKRKQVDLLFKRRVFGFNATSLLLRGNIESVDKYEVWKKVKDKNDNEKDDSSED